MICSSEQMLTEIFFGGYDSTTYSLDPPCLMTSQTSGDFNDQQEGQLHVVLVLWNLPLPTTRISQSNIETIQGGQLAIKRRDFTAELWLWLCGIPGNYSIYLYIQTNLMEHGDDRFDYGVICLTTASGLTLLKLVKWYHEMKMRCKGNI